MSDIAGKQMLKLMQEIDELETKLENVEKEIKAVAQSPAGWDTTSLDRIRGHFIEQLNLKRGELARINSGCGQPGKK